MSTHCPEDCHIISLLFSYNTQHASRTFHDIDGNIIREESGIYHLPFDYYGINSLKNAVPALKLAKKFECEDAPYCGLPYYFPMIMFLE